MRSRRLIWLVLSVMIVVTAGCASRTVTWRELVPSAPSGERAGGVAEGGTQNVQSIVAPKLSASVSSQTEPASPHPVALADTDPAILHTTASAPRRNQAAASLSRLVRSPSALLLENALLDTAQPVSLPIPEHLRAQGDPGAYVVQSRAPLDDAFRARLRAAEAAIVAYIPNQAYLVRASEATARELQSDPRTQAVVPYEPYYKLKPPLLTLAIAQQPVPPGQMLHLLVFPDAADAAAGELASLGLEVVGRERSPFGPVLTVQPQSAGVPAGAAAILPALARLASVQEVELARARVLANDLSRARIGVAADTTASRNYLGLTGESVLVAVADSGVDGSHPDLQGRVLCDVPASGIDTNGHGTHVAGIIAGSGMESTTVTQASGSVMPGAGLQFRGQAPAARVLAIAASAVPGPASDSYLQGTAARANALIANNSWHYADANTYDLAAARYDAAVRDALPEVSGPQPLLFVFGAGNTGNGAEDGSGGEADSVQSPATAKNVIAVGAVDQPRLITNQVWQCTTVGETNVCQTNQPWLGLTYTNTVVAAFSSRGNVGVGIEGACGRVKPDVVAPGTFVVSARSAQWDKAAYYGPASTNSNYFVVLSNLNETLGPFYRYESGSSLSAAAVSGVLALMQEFFQGFGRTNSPALMKALLINGARPLGDSGGFQAAGVTNSAGWGLINLTNTLPPDLSNSFVQAAAPMQVFDQDPAGALATGQSRTRFVSLSAAAASQPLRVTLVWTDPPGNPAARLKLVNNLDLIVTNLDTGEVFLGNDIPAGGSVNQVWDTNLAPNSDTVNNVENVYLSPVPATHYSVTVLARAVNVNAVSTRVNDVVQDYALVISSGDGQVADALQLCDAPVVCVASEGATLVTNSFDPGQGISGALLLNQRVGARSPAFDGAGIPWAGGGDGVVTAGSTNQWRFYVLTNDQDYPYAAFATFQPVNLSLPRLGVDQASLTNATRAEADIDLYVSTDPGLTNLDLAALAAADKALGRRGTHAIVYNNVAAGAVYYVGVKVEDQEAAEYAFLGVFSLLPFGEQDQNGSWTLRGINLPAVIPDGTATTTGMVSVVAIAPAPVAVRRVVVTNELWHEGFTNLVGTLSHNLRSAVLRNHTAPPGDPVPYDGTWVYEDNGEGDIPGAQSSDGPDSLRNFVGTQGLGVWLLTLADNCPGQTGRVQNLAIRLDPQAVVSGAPRQVLAHACAYDFLDVPIGVTNLALCLYNDEAAPLPLELYLRRGDFPTQSVYDRMLVADSAVNCWSFTPFTLPPVTPGRYYIGVFNTNNLPQAIRLAATLSPEAGSVAPVLCTSAEPTPILDDAVTYASLLVSNRQPIASVDVALLATNLPRVADMVFTLISPAGTRVLLCDGRGGATTNGLGGIVLRTKIIPTRHAGDYNADTTNLFVGYNPGTLTIDYDFYQAPDTMHVYYGDERIYDSGLASNTNHVSLPFGPGVQTNTAGEIVIAMNEWGNGDTNSLWEYTASVVSLGPGYVVFTENPNLSPVPIKFAATPFLPPETSWDLFCLPEESLNALAGENACGTWQLEMLDTRAGATVPAPVLDSWQLRFVFRNTAPVPISLPRGIAGTNTIPPCQVAPFAVDVPAWATRATNILVYASGPVNVWFNQDLPPTGTNAGDVMLLVTATNGVAVLDAGGMPPLVPGARCYLGVQNPGLADVTAALQADYEITPLSDGMPISAVHAGNTLPQYFFYDVSSNATAAAFQLFNLSGNVNLVASREGSLPTLASFDYGRFSAGTNDEEIVVFTNSMPVPLAPGRWYLGVFNADPVGVAYTILAAEYTNPFPNIITLTNRIACPNANSGAGDATDYYHFVVTAGAARAQFEINGATGDMTLVARKGLPLPTLASYACLSANPGLNDELITLFDFSRPVSLTPGDWFISAVNLSGAPVDYEIKATEFPVSGTNIVITVSRASSYGFCLTWNSLPGVHYFVEGKAEVNSTNWTLVSPTLTASEAMVEYCVSLPSAFNFFRVGEGIALAPQDTSVSIDSIALGASGVRLQWLAPATSRFRLQWTPSLAPPAWDAFTDIVTSTNGTFEFLDDGTQTGGLDGPRYYRLERVP